jgi:hydroxymethylbilane synthase
MGDVDKTTPLPSLGKGLWTNELEAQLFSREVDLVVHSLKDMPTTLPDGLVLSCVTSREDPRDVVVFKAAPTHAHYKALADLPAGAVVGTSSVRRAAQLRRRYPGLVFRDVRGNIDTRLKKVDAPDGGYDCIILAAAGLLRMDFGARISQYLDSRTPGGGLLHAVGQGALGIETRADDDRMRALLHCITDEPTMLAAFAERSIMRALEGGCSVPIGVETTWVGDDAAKKLQFRATVVSLDGTEGVDGEATEAVASLDEADGFGKRMAQDLVAKGAQQILDVINKDRAAGEASAVKVGDGVQQAAATAS